MNHQAFDIVSDAVTTDNPDGIAQLAWNNLFNRYQPQNLNSKIYLIREYSNCTLSSKNIDPVEFFVKFCDILRRSRTQADLTYTEDDQVSHILGTICDDYSEIVTALSLQSLQNPDFKVTMSLLKRSILDLYNRKFKNSSNSTRNVDFNANLDVNKAKKKHE